jgi:predicted DNA-binding transcriptional regulator YafY
MPKNKNAFIRYRLIDAALRNKHKPYPTKNELIEACSGLGSVSARTIDKDIYDMKFDEELAYFAPIEFDRLHKGYFYTDAAYAISKIPLKHEDLYAMEFACSILKQFEGIDTVKQFMQSVGKIEDFISMQRTLDNSNWNELIQTERALEYKGNQFLSPLLKAIKERYCLLIHYQRFGETGPKVHQFHPYVLKEYRNRWYVCGWSEKKSAIITFALERIVDVISEKARFEVQKSFDASSYFAFSYGISVTNNYEPVEIVLEFTPVDAYYIKSMPLHHTQKIVTDNTSKFVISITIIPSYEFKSDVLSYGNRVKVISPKWLADEHQETLKLALNNYAANS